MTIRDQRSATPTATPRGPPTPHRRHHRIPPITAAARRSLTTAGTWRRPLKGIPITVTGRCSSPTRDRPISRMIRAARQPPIHRPVPQPNRRPAAYTRLPRHAVCPDGTPGLDFGPPGARRRLLIADEIARLFAEISDFRRGSLCGIVG